MLSAELYLKALRADFLPLLHPGDARFGVAQRLAHEGRHSSRDSRLVVGGLDEAGHACRREGGKQVSRKDTKTGRKVCCLGSVCGRSPLMWTVLLWKGTAGWLQHKNPGMIKTAQMLLKTEDHGEPEEFRNQAHLFGDGSTRVRLILGEMRRRRQQRSRLVVLSLRPSVGTVWRSSTLLGTLAQILLTPSLTDFSRRTTCVRSFWSFTFWSFNPNPNLTLTTGWWSSCPQDCRRLKSGSDSTSLGQPPLHHPDTLVQTERLMSLLGVPLAPTLQLDLFHAEEQVDDGW